MLPCATVWQIYEISVVAQQHWSRIRYVVVNPLHIFIRFVDENNLKLLPHVAFTLN